MSTAYDAIVIGAGHNGLLCALDLARAGRRVLLLEAADQVGGAATTRIFAPGFQVSACAHLLHGLPQSLVQELNLSTHGLRFSATQISSYALDPAGGAIRMAGAQASGPGLSAGDVAAYASLRTRMGRYAGVFATLFSMTPPRLSLKGWRERFDMLRLALRLRLLGTAPMRELLRIAGMNAFDLLDDNLHSPLLKGALAFDATLGADYGPRAPSTVLSWLHRLAGEQQAGTLGLAQPHGGMGALCDALAKACGAAGVEIRLQTRVTRITVKDDHASGVVLADGNTVAAPVVVSSAALRATLLGMLGVEHLDAGCVRRVRNFRSRGLVAKLHLALRGAPVFRGVDAAALAGRLLISPSMDYLEQAFNPSKYREIPEHPALEITLPSVNDPTLAPAGQHVLSALVQFVPYDLGPEPQAAKTRLLANTMATLEQYAPGISDLVVASELLTPADLERAFGLEGGHWHQGGMTFDQFFINRPVALSHQYRSPLPGLYLCGAASHPGGGVSGWAGRNAAREVLKDGVRHGA